ncbi:hypothetical protein FRC04_008690 [Tulasnella sp. 424]|nr:hypothetical protein FRC04_008690 [Tulasnella sp. 424]KAG8979922.1 hypothetical protein FRC05_007365 [Tulasnella sp. 425]
MDQRLRDLQDNGVTHPDFPGLFQSSMADLREHMRSEENDLVKLEASMPREESEALARLFREARFQGAE